MDISASLLGIASAFLFVAVSPGPANIATASIAMRFGRKKGLVFGFGLSVGLAFWGLVAATGLGAILQSSVYVLTVLKIAGGLYLLWLAFQTLRSAASDKADKAAPEAAGSWFWRGFLLNISNPKAVVAWLAALSMGLQNETSTSFVIWAYLICAVIGFANYTAHAVIFSMEGVMTRYNRYRRHIESAVAGLFALAGFGLLRSALTR